MVSTKHCWGIKWGVGKDWQSTTMASWLASQWHHANDCRYRLVMRLLDPCRYYRVQETRCQTKIIHTDRLQRLESMMKDERRVVPFDASVDLHGCKSNTYMNSTSIDSINIERIRKE
jgi:hypothetical protein